MHNELSGEGMMRKLIMLFVCLLICSGNISDVCAGGNALPTGSVMANLPPDPGDAGKATLEGIDSDNDGVRDDVQRWIAITYPDSEKTRAALTQEAKLDQEFILNSTDSNMSMTIARQMMNSEACLAYVQPNDYYEIGIEFQAIFLNTYARSKAWLQADRHLSGTMFSGLPYSQRKQGCDFNPDLMPN